MQTKPGITMRINNEAAHAIRGMMDRAIEAPIHRDQRDIEAAVYDEASFC